MRTCVGVGCPALGLHESTRFSTVTRNKCGAGIFYSVKRCGGLGRVLQRGNNFLLASRILSSKVSGVTFCSFIGEVHLRGTSGNICMARRLCTSGLCLLRLDFRGTIVSRRATLFYRNLVRRRPIYCSTAAEGGYSRRQLDQSNIAMCTLPRDLLEVKIVGVRAPCNRFIPICSVRQAMYSLIRSNGRNRMRLLRDILGECVYGRGGHVKGLVRCTRVFQVSGRVRGLLVRLSQGNKTGV